MTANELGQAMIKVVLEGKADAQVGWWQEDDQGDRYWVRVTGVEVDKVGDVELKGEAE